MRSKLRQIGKLQWLGVTVLVGIVAVTILAVVPATRSRIAWGTAPNWVTVGAGLIALASVVIAIRTFETAQRHRRDDEASHARLLLRSVTTTIVEDTPAYGQMEIKFRNASTEPFSLVRIIGVTHNGRRCEQTVRDQLLDLKNQSLVHLEPTNRTSTNWKIPKGEKVFDPDANIQIRFTYLDSSGRRWDRLDNREPQRIYGRPPSEAELEEFVIGMNNIDSDD